MVHFDQQQPRGCGVRENVLHHAAIGQRAGFFHLLFELAHGRHAMPPRKKEKGAICFQKHPNFGAGVLHAGAATMAMVGRFRAVNRLFNLLLHLCRFVRRNTFLDHFFPKFALQAG